MNILYSVLTVVPLTFGICILKKKLLFFKEQLNNSSGNRSSEFRKSNGIVVMCLRSISTRVQNYYTSNVFRSNWNTKIPLNTQRLDNERL